MLSVVGLGVEADYRLVGEATAPPESLGYRTQVWAPRDEAANVAACESALG